jgi:hypothetical protein
MAIKPILFNTEMVRAILDGRKTCTRRVAKNVPDHTHRIEPIYENGRFQFDCFYSSYVAALDADADFCMPCFPPYQQGDILYVRETFIQAAAHTFWYKADDNSWMPEGLHWRPSIHMPKAAARIWLKVTDVRVERLQDITFDSCKNEGIYDDYKTYSEAYANNLRRVAYPKAFARLWDSTIEKSDIDRYGWNANPWVWVIEFERCEKPKEV